MVRLGAVTGAKREMDVVEARDGRRAPVAVATCPSGSSDDDVGAWACRHQNSDSACLDTAGYI